MNGARNALFSLNLCCHALQFSRAGSLGPPNVVPIEKVHVQSMWVEIKFERSSLILNYLCEVAVLWQSPIVYPKILHVHVSSGTPISKFYQLDYTPPRSGIDYLSDCQRLTRLIALRVSSSQGMRANGWLAASLIHIILRLWTRTREWVPSIPPPPQGTHLTWVAHIVAQGEEVSPRELAWWGGQVHCSFGVSVGFGFWYCCDGENHFSIWWSQHSFPTTSTICN